MANAWTRLLPKLLITTLLMLSILTCAIPPHYSETQMVSDLKFSASLDKYNYLINEIIWLHLQIQNLNKYNVYALSIDPIYGNLNFYIVTTTGDTLKGACIRGLYIEAPTLGPWEKDMHSENLLGDGDCWFGIDSKEAVFSRLIPPGEYTIQVELLLYPTRLYQRERYSIFSDKLKFKVEEPQGEEKDVYNLLVKGNKKLWKDKKREEGFELLRRIVTNYPQSAYVDAAYSRLDFMFDRKENAIKFLSKYPNSGLVIRILRLKSPEDEDERRKFFKQIIEKYPGSRASAYAKILLNKKKRAKLWEDRRIDWRY